jgi:ABC-type transporter Mla subunit MlaD
MRRIAAIVGVAAAAGALLVFGSAAGGEEGTYEVRAIFDNGGFLVPAEEVRIAGARVGAISEVDVTGEDEAAHADGSPEPGKAVVVLEIDDAAFQDFREDASCIVRPQSLLGERFVECQVTQPRADGSEPPPPLEQIPEGEPGEGQYLLPVERNGKAVDLDLVNNIMREPYPDRFRLILNDLGAALAARGDDLDAVIERANPALRRTDEVLAILRKQNKDLERLARDGDQVLQPLAAKRDRIGGFINSAAVTAQATAERRADLEAQIQKLPGFLRELRLTMAELDDFATSSTPVVSDLSDAAPDLTRINTALGPFADAATTSLKSLGDAAEAAGPDLVASQPVLRDVKDLAEVTAPVAKTLRSLLVSLRQEHGYRNLTGVIYNAAGSVNAFDSYGHFLRATLPLNNCVGYDTTPAGGGGVSCNALWANEQAKAVQLSPRQLRLLKQQADDRAARLLPSEDEQPQEPAPDLLGPADIATEAFDAFGSTDEPAPTEEPEAEAESGADAANLREAKVLLDYLIGPRGDGGAR